MNKQIYSVEAKTSAKDLLGKFLVRRVNGKTTAYMIVETEAYLGEEDKASHARSGMTKRNEPMFGKAGVWYVYLTYGMHYMLNIVTGNEGRPSAVLIRSVIGVTGPGRLTKALRITKSLNMKSASKNNGLWIEDGGVKISPKDIFRTPRIGIAYAEEWATKPLRYIVKGYGIT